MRHPLAAAAAVFGACALLIVALYAVGMSHAPATPTLQGDALGPDSGESAEEYLQRAAATLDSARRKSAPGDSHLALVAFDAPQSCDAAAAAYRDVPRVNAIVPEGLPPKDTPEPVGETSAGRGEVCEREARRAVQRESGAGPDWAQASVLLAGAVVTADVATLSRLAESSHVRSVEVLPADAVWGAIAVRNPGVYSASS